MGDGKFNIKEQAGVSAPLGYFDPVGLCPTDQQGMFYHFYLLFCFILLSFSGPEFLIDFVLVPFWLVRMEYRFCNTLCCNLCN
jgi:hypothetical protein